MIFNMMFNLVAYALLSSATIINAVELLPNSCEDLEDGLHWLKFMDGDEYPAIQLQCSNGYAILDYTKDNNIQEYFTSWSEWHVGTTGPTNDYSINWQDWFVPDITDNPKSSFNLDSSYFKQQKANMKTNIKSHTDSDSDSTTTASQSDYYGPQSTVMNYLISPDCSSCERENTRQLYTTSTTYWMTGTLYGCFWAVKGAHNCDVDWDTDTCYTCVEDSSEGHTLVDQGHTRVSISDTSTPEEYDATGICPHNVRSANSYVPLSHDECSHDEGSTKKHLKPSLGVKGQYCVCVQPKSPYSSYFEVESVPESPLIMQEMTDIIETNKRERHEHSNALELEHNMKVEVKNNIENEDSMDIYELTQKEFQKGTLRIQKSGKYVIMEDIMFDFASNRHRPNDLNAYWPDSKDRHEYPGASSGRDAYFLGFFAGITIECDNVILELNSHKLEMSEYFYYQQRWFTTIELSTQYFLPGQGIGNFGANPRVASNVIIRNGVLGLSSHHGIHGNYNKNIQIDNVVIRDFETHGIQFNGFNNINLNNIEIGPTSTKSYFNGEYGHMRGLLPRFKAIASQLPDESVQFYGRDESVTMRDISDEIQRQLDMAFDYVVHGKRYDAENSAPDVYESYQSMLKLFINENGIPNGGAQYGIFLNTFGASVFTYNLYTGYYSENANLNNIKIHDMTHEMKEYVRVFRPHSGDIMINPFNGPLNAEELFEDMNDLDNLRYKGNIVLDSYIAMNYLTDNWDYLQMQLVLNDFITPWAFGNDFETMKEDTVSFGCNSDVMIHSGKGINGLRLDGVKNVNIKDISVWNLYDSSPVGSEQCGEYDDLACASCGNNGGHFRQTQPMQVGFSGNMNQAININAAIDVTIENININNIQSATGPVFGVSIWPACEVTLKGDVVVSNLQSGVNIEEGMYSYEDRPNKAPETCGVRVYWEYGDYTTSVDYDEANIQSECLKGHVGCLGDSLNEESMSMLGTGSMKCLNDIEDDKNSRIFDNLGGSWVPKNFALFNTNQTYLIALIAVAAIILIYIMFAVYYYYCCQIKMNGNAYERITDIQLKKPTRLVENGITEASALLVE